MTRCSRWEGVHGATVAAVLLREFSPLAVLLTEFVYAQERRGFPFLVGSQALKDLQDYVGGEHVEFRNTRVVGPVPYVGDDVSIFLGLCRTVTNDVSDHLFKLLDTITKTFDTTGLTRLVDIAGPLRSGLSDLLGMKNVELRLGHHVTFTGAAGPYEFRSGYYAYANAAERTVDPATLWVKDDRLVRGDTAPSATPFADADSCLRIDRMSQRSDYVTSPFHRSWVEAKRSLFAGDEDGARRAFVNLVRDVSVSTDLTTEHRCRLMQAYTADFERERDLAARLHRVVAAPRGGEPAGTRGGGAQRFSPAAADAHRRGLARSGVDALFEISAAWQPLIDHVRPGEELTADVLNGQMETVRRVKRVLAPDPAALADVLTVTHTPRADG
jgi:hypothetical protein